jgi:hypothetical protein
MTSYFILSIKCCEIPTKTGVGPFILYYTGLVQVTGILYYTGTYIVTTTPKLILSKVRSPGTSQIHQAHPHL